MRTVQVVVFVVVCWTVASAVRSSDRDQTEWDIHLYLEDHQMTSADGLGVAVRVQNRSSETRWIRTDVYFRRVVEPTTRKIDANTSDGHQRPERLAPGEGPTADRGLANELAKYPRIEVVIEGPFASSDGPWLMTRSENLSTISLEQNQECVKTASTPANVFPAGEYTVRAVLYDGKAELASSKVHHIQVDQETSEEQQRRMRIYKWLPPGTKLVPVR